MIRRTRIKKFFSYYRPYLRQLIFVLLCALISSAAALFFPLTARYIVQQLFSFPQKDLVLPCLLLFLFIVIEFGCSFYFDYFGHSLGAQMENDMRQELFSHMQNLSFSYYDTHQIGRLMSSLTHDLLNLSELYHHGPEDYIVYGLRFIGASIILFSINPFLTFLLYLYVPVMLAVTIFCSRRIRRISAQNQQNISTVNDQAEDILSGIRTVQAYCAQKQACKSFSAQANAFLSSRKKVYLEETYPSQGLLFLSRLMFLTTLLAGGISILHGTLSLADLLAFLLYINYLTEPIEKLAWMTTQLQEGLAGFDRFMNIIETPPQIVDLPDAIPLENISGEISFEHVSFRYHAQEPEVLHDLSFRIPAGQTVAFTGPSGIGKTTICALISRFYEPQKGHILIDGNDISQYTLSSLRSHIASVRQDVYLFNGTISDNIRLGKPNASEAEIIAAAKKANAHHFIAKLPNGYQSQVGPKGIRLSVGQRQRIEIARAFLKNAPILILDEATSALDYQSEKEVQHALEALRTNRTTIIIAHRLSTIQHADCIIVLGKQGILEQGSHSELLSKNGLYAQLYKTPTENCDTYSLI